MVFFLSEDLDGGDGVVSDTIFRLQKKERKKRPLIEGHRVRLSPVGSYHYISSGLQKGNEGKLGGNAGRDLSEGRLEARGRETGGRSVLSAFPSAIHKTPTLWIFKEIIQRKGEVAGGLPEEELAVAGGCLVAGCPVDVQSSGSLRD